VTGLSRYDWLLYCSVMYSAYPSLVEHAARHGRGWTLSIGGKLHVPCEVALPCA